MLHHDHGIAQIAQIGQRAEQTIVVALVQADGRLVEHVHHAHQARADLAREPDALGLAARERLGAAIQTQIIQPHIDQEIQPLDDFLADALGDLAAPSRQRQLGKKRLRLAHRPGRQHRQRNVLDEDVARRAVESGAAAVRTRARADELGQFLANEVGVRLAVTALEIGDDALERVTADQFAAALGQVAELDLALAAAAQDHLADRLRQLGERCFHVEAIGRAQRLNHLEIVGRAPIPAAHRAAGQTELGMGHDARRIKELLHAQAVALRARAGGIVERELARLEFLHAVAAMRAGEARRKQDFAALRFVHEGQHRQPVPESQCRLQALGQPLAGIGPHPQPVHHGLDAMLALRIEHRQRLEFAHRAIHPRPHQPLVAQVDEHLAVFALAILHQGREDHDPQLLGQRQHLIDHLTDRLRGERHVVVRAAGDPGSRVEQAQIVVDLGNRTHRGAGIVRRRFLFDGNRRRQAFDVVDVGLVHQRQELARIGRERFDVAPLSFGIERVEGERGFPGAGQTRDADQPVARQIEVHVLEIVGSGAPNPDRLHRLTAGNPTCYYNHPQ